MLSNDVWGWKAVSDELNKQGNCYKCTVSLADPASAGLYLSIGMQGVVALQSLIKVGGTRDDTPYIPTGATEVLWPQSGDQLWDADGVVAIVHNTNSSGVEYTITATSAVISNVIDL